jgi:uncharacterized membrane protein YciS (DUF1049 family)
MSLSLSLSVRTIIQASVHEFVLIHSWQRLVVSTTTIFVTTLEDSIWLVSFCVNASTVQIGLIHVIIYIVSFTMLSLLICLTTTIVLLLSYISTSTTTTTIDGTNNNNTTSSTLLTPDELINKYSVLTSAIGAALCWVLFGFFYYKAQQKLKKKQLKMMKKHNEDTVNLETNIDNESITLLVNDNSTATTVSNNYGALENNKITVPDTDDDDNRPSISSVHFWTVVSLTTLGALDEVTYFPSLILANIFTPAELIIGTTIAACLILLVVYCFLSPFKPILRFLDKIPTYGVIGMFAILLTIEVLWDLLSSD